MTGRGSPVVRRRNRSGRVIGRVMTRYQAEPDRFMTVHNGVPGVRPARVLDYDTGRELSLGEFDELVGRDLCGPYLDMVNAIIRSNADSVLPERLVTTRTGSDGRQRTSTEQTNMYARRVMTVPAEQDVKLTHPEWAEPAWTRIGAQCAALALITPYQKVRDLWNECHDPDTGECTGVPADLDERLDGYVDAALIRNTLKRRNPPSVPVVRTPVLRLGSMGTQCGYRALFSDHLLLHAVAIGSHRYEIIIDSAWLWERYPNLKGISMPNVRVKDGRVLLDFDVTEEVAPQPTTTNSVIAVDRNADHDQCISAVRISSNGWVSNELGPSRQTLSIIRHLNAARRERDKSHKALDRRAGQKKTKRATEHDERTIQSIHHLDERIDRLQSALDESQMEDLLHHVNPGEAIGAETLRWFPGTSTFRHGQTDEALKHKCEKAGINLILVNPANTTRNCACGHPMRINTTTHEATCTNPDPHGDPRPDGTRDPYRTNRHENAAVNIGVETLQKLGWATTGQDHLKNLHTTRQEQARSQRKQTKRARKNQKREAQGKRTRQPKTTPTPRRPRPARHPNLTNPKWKEVIQAKQQGKKKGPRNSGATSRVPEQLPTGKWEKAQTTTQEPGTAIINALIKNLQAPGHALKRARAQARKNKQPTRLPSKVSD